MRTSPLAGMLAFALACGSGGDGGVSAGAPAGTGPTGPSTPTAPTSSARLERLDDHAECDGLVPDHAPEPVEVTWAAPADATCAGGISDGTGHVAVSARTGGGVAWQVFGPDGTARGSFVAGPLVPEPAGWHALSLEPRGDQGTRVKHQRYAPAGDLVVEADASSDPDQLRSEAWSLAQDPKGGCLTVVGEVDLFHNHWTRLEAQRFDETGRPRWPQHLAFDASSEHAFLFVAAGVSVRGEALAIRQDASRVNATWMGADGAAVARSLEPEPYAALTGSSEYRPYQVDLVPLLDGDLAVRVDGVFRRRYPHLATATEPLPAWLAARAAWGFRFTRGNRGYALFPPAGAEAPRCEQAIELLAPTGRLCGRVTLPGAGAACTTGAVDQGWDGTVVQQRDGTACAWRFWPGLLGR